MPERGSINARAIKRLVLALPLIFGYHLFAPPGITGEGVTCHRVIPGEHTRGHQRGGSGEKAGGVTTRVRRTLGKLHPLTLPGQQLRKAIDPAGRGAMGGRGVDYLCAVVLNERHSLSGRGVGQAQEHQIRIIQELFPLLRVLALFRIDAQELDILPAAQALIYLEPRGPLLAVDKHFGSHSVLASTNSLMCSICVLTESGAGPP